MSSFATLEEKETKTYKDYGPKKRVGPPESSDYFVLMDPNPAWKENILGIGATAVVHRGFKEEATGNT